MSYTKTIFRMIKDNYQRFLAMLLIIMVGIAFVCGVGGISPKIKDSIRDYYYDVNLADYVVKSKSEYGFTSSEIENIKNSEKVINYTTVTQLDLPNTTIRIKAFDFNTKINKLTLDSGRLPKDSNECVLINNKVEGCDYALNDTINVNGLPLTVVGFVNEPNFLARNQETHVTDGTLLDTYIYLDTNYNTMFSSIITDIYLDMGYKKGVKNWNNYVKLVKDNKEKTTNIIGEASNYVTLIYTDNYGAALIESLCDKIDIIALVFPVFFVLVVGLVTLTNTSRLIDDERKSIGCLRSLGYSKNRIMFKYLSFSFVSTLIGSAIGIVIGMFTIPIIVYPAFEGIFIMPNMTNKYSIITGLISSGLMILAVMLVTFIVARKTVNQTSANLFRLKAPKPGKKIVLERIKFIWNRFSFKYKSSIRNIIRFKGRLLMTVISIAGSTVLVFAGFGLYDVSGGDVELFGMVINIGETIAYIALAVVFAALALSILVLYNLASMDIGERQREIATLKVLGYRNSEVYGYIFREIFIMSLMGIILGIPCGVALLGTIFKMMEFGSLKDIHFYSYLLTFGFSILFVVIVMLMLLKKIRKINMNDSLKSLD